MSCSWREVAAGLHVLPIHGLDCRLCSSPSPRAAVQPPGCEMVYKHNFPFAFRNARVLSESKLPNTARQKRIQHLAPCHFCPTWWVSMGFSSTLHQAINVYPRVTHPQQFGNGAISVAKGKKNNYLAERKAIALKQQVHMSR